MKNILILFLFSFQVVFAQNMDIQLLKNIHIGRNQHLDKSMIFLSDSDAGISLLVPTSIYAIGFLTKDSLTKQKAFAIGTSLVINTAFTVALKHGINRTRPFEKYSEIQNVVEADSPSFPSGHTSTAFSTATSLSIAYPKWYVIAPSFLWASSIGYSRMHLGVHYPSDVLAGAIVGSGSAWLSHFLTKKLQEYGKKRKR